MRLLCKLLKMNCFHSALLLSFIFHGTILSFASDVQTTVQIETGLVEGVTNQEGSVIVFKGIPYAAAPIGDLRWREPQPAHKWDGVRRADTWGAACVQPASSLLPPYTAEFASTTPTSEDCLFLNIWAPVGPTLEHHAILFYIHGGSGTRGSGSVSIYDGEELARKGIIVVTVNFRLGIFSGMGHPELTKESPNRTCGNYGMLDLIAALRWVQANIASFGGNPEKVTICGQSSGSVAMHYLTTSLVAKGLFRSAIGVSFPYDYLTKRHAIGNVWQKEQEGLKFAVAKNMRSIDELRQIPASELIADDPAVGSFTRNCLSGSPNIDGWSFIDKYPEALDKGLASDVPTLTGMTADDFGPPAEFMYTTVKNFRITVPSLFGERKQAFEKHQADFLTKYPVMSDQDARQLAKQIQIEYRLFDIAHWVKRRSRTAKTPVYSYLFEKAIPWPQQPRFGAFHSSDLVYWFNNLKQLDRPWTDVDRRIADEASSYWVNFVKTGNPNGKGLPEWLPADENRPVTMVLNPTSGARELADAERLAFYLSLNELPQ